MSASRAAARPWARTFPLVVASASVVTLLIIVGSSDLDTIETRLLEPQRVAGLLLEHLAVALGASALVTIVGVGAGIVVTRPRARRAATPTVSLANICQAIPDIGILVLLALAIGLGTKTLLLTLVLYTVLPVLRNTITGLQETPSGVLDAARGQGFTPAQLLWRVELPLAVPAILAGIRTAILLSVGVATAGAFIAAGGLGQLIVDGIGTNRTPVLLTGAVLVSALALVLDYLASVAEQVLRPRGLQISR